jgi:hypothetical protein
VRGGRYEPSLLLAYGVAVTVTASAIAVEPLSV